MAEKTEQKTWYENWLGVLKVVGSCGRVSIRTDANQNVRHEYIIADQTGGYNAEQELVLQSKNLKARGFKTDLTLYDDREGKDSNLKVDLDNN